MGMLREYRGDGTIWPPRGICEHCWNNRSKQTPATFVVFKVPQTGWRLMTPSGEVIPDSYYLCEQHAKSEMDEGWKGHRIEPENLLMQP